MEKEQAYPSLSFFKFLFDSSVPKISIPPNFTKRIGNKMLGNWELEANENYYNVKCEKIDKLCYFTQGWLRFVEAVGLETGYFLLFELNQETSSFIVSVYDYSQACSYKQLLPHSLQVSNMFTTVKEEPSLTPSTPKQVAETDSESSLKQHIKSQIEDPEDDVDKLHEDSQDLTWSSLSFSVTFKKHNWMAIPEDFAKKTGIANHRRVVLKDTKGKRWTIDLKPIKGGQMKLTSGWEDFQRALKVDSSVTCIFEFKEKYVNVLKVDVKRGRGRPRKQ